MFKITRFAIFIICLHISLYSQNSLEVEIGSEERTKATQVDTLNYVTILESNNQMIQSQNGILIGFMGVIVVLFIMLLGWQFTWNKSEMKKNVQFEVAETLEKYGESTGLKLENMMKAKFEEINENYEFKFQLADLQIVQLLALGSGEAGFNGTSILHWSEVLRKSKELGRDASVRKAAEMIIDTFESRELAASEMDEDRINEIISNLEHMPEILDREKTKILQLLKSFQNTT